MLTKTVKYTLFPGLIAVIFLSCSHSQDKFVLRNADKLIVVLTQDWDSTPAKIYLLENHNEKWEFSGKKYTGVVGQHGMGWGVGLHDTLHWEQKFPYREKLEGDLRTPAGIYTLSEVMGYDSLLPVQTVKKYIQIHGYMHAVDDTSSVYYNQIVDTNSFADGFRNHYNSYEDLAYMGPVYKWLFIIDHNANRIRGRGSNIYFHIRRSNGKGTGGCTAVTEDNILEIIHWLDKSTLILQLPEKIYARVNGDLGLPDIED